MTSCRMCRQSFQIPVQVTIAFSLFLCVDTYQLSAFGEDGTLVGDLWAGAGGSLVVAVGWCWWTSRSI